MMVMMVISYVIRISICVVRALVLNGVSAGHHSEVIWIRGVVLSDGNKMLEQ